MKRLGLCLACLAVFALPGCTGGASRPAVTGEAPPPTSTAAPTTPPRRTETPAVGAASPQGGGAFEPPPGRVLLFVGQDNASVGGVPPYTGGYVDLVGLPAGVTGYVYMVEGWTNRFGYTFDTGTIDGLNREAFWGGGPVCTRCYLESPVFSNAIMHLSISMVAESEVRIAEGSYDYLVDELAGFLREFEHHPFFLRIGYEFDGSRNEYDPQAYRAAFRRIVDRLRAAGLSNFVTVMSATSVGVSVETWELYYPGDDYVDWVGYSYWGREYRATGSLDFARAHGKPVFIAESGPVANYLSVADGPAVWEAWFEPYVAHIRENLDAIKAISYINCHWEAQPMWIGRNWGDTRIQANAYIHYRWEELLYDPMFVTGADPVFELIGFRP